MRAAWTMFCISAVILAAALGLAHLLVPDVVPDVVPVAFAEEPQGAWAVMTAFMLRAIAMMAAAIAIIALAVLAGGLVVPAGSRTSRDMRARRFRMLRRS